MLSKFRKYIYPLDVIVDLVPISSNILDLGCGDGHIVDKLKKRSFKFYKGIDPKINNETKIGNIRLCKNLIEDVISEVSDYNCILMIDVMHHIKKQHQKNN